MRTITDHKLNGLNDALEITVLDEPGQGGANHHYRIEGHALDLNPSAGPGLDKNGNPKGTSVRPGDIFFQNGPIKEAGVNGISGEALLAIVIDRLRSFQAGPYASDDNERALYHTQEALTCLQKRTRDRLARGVEGTNAK